MVFRDIEYFLMVVECLNFSAAAEKLYISQPGLSKVISNLEKSLGVKLFERSTRRVKLTEAGRRFYIQSKNYMEYCAKLSEKGDAEEIVGSLAIGFGNVVDDIYLPSIIEKFQEKYPGISIASTFSSSETMLNNIETRHVDVGLISSFAIPPQGFQSSLLCRCKLHLVVWKGHPFSDRNRIKLEELKDENFVFIERNVNRGSDILSSMCARAGFSPKIIEYTNDFRLMFMLITQKKGVTFNLTLPDVDTYKNLCCIEVDMSDYPDIEAMAGMALVWKKKDCNPIVPLFIRVMEENRPDLALER